MTAVFHRLVSLVLLLGILGPTAPTGLWHDHHEMVLHCEAHEHDLAQDACHNRIYHQKTGGECEHKAHLAEGRTDCDYCKFISSIRHQLAEFREGTGVITPLLIAVFRITDQQGAVAFACNTPGRGPPSL